MNRQVVAMLTGVGIGLTAVVHASVAVSGDEPAVHPASEAVDGNEGAPADGPEAEMQTNTFEERLRLQLETIDADRDGRINGYIDPPTDAWHARVSSRRWA